MNSAMLNLTLIKQDKFTPSLEQVYEPIKILKELIYVF